MAKASQPVNDLLTQGNTKLGKRIGIFSLPAIHTCPGSTALCRAACYAARGRYLMANVQRRLASNLAATKSADFVSRMVRECKRQSVVRFHASGDFYSADYVRAWIKIAKRCKSTRFYGYTRSWSLPDIREALIQFSELDNVRLFYSIDADSEHIPTSDAVRFAWLSIDGTQLAPVELPTGRVIVFRDKRRRVMKYNGAGQLVCPVENGAKVDGMTCDSCTICFSDRPIPSRCPSPVPACNPKDYARPQLVQITLK